jgi:hypothetical protein
MVAKIYDPLYYKFFNDYGYKENVLWTVDGDYSREAAAYLELQKSPSTIEVTPRFYGTFTMDVETCTERRQVPFILIELVRGTTMLKTKPGSLLEDVRSAILKKAIYAESVISHADILHNDFCPRNVIVLNFDCSKPDNTLAHIERAKVKIIDFNTSEVRSHTSHKHQAYLQRKHKVRTCYAQLPSPIVRHRELFHEFHGWISGRDGEVEKWLWQQFHDDDRFRPVVWESQDPDITPKCADEIEE